MERERTYLCIDLKTFYASVECIDRGLDPFTTNLVVADPDRGESTICLAVSPALKRLGVPGRCRVFDIPKGIDYLKIKPRMRHYMEVSAQIYGIYLEHVSATDIHVYSIDECFIDATGYLALYGLTAEQFAQRLIDAVGRRTGICATAGIGPNLFLAKVALDITAKHTKSGIGVLDEERFRQTIWRHRPITDIWGIGPGIAARLAAHNVHDLMGVAALDERILYDELGVNAEYLIDHAHGYEPCTIAEIQAYRPEASSMVNAQVLPHEYDYEQARTVLHEMVDASVLDLVHQGVVCDHISLTVGYGREPVQARNKPACIDPAHCNAVDDTLMLNEKRPRKRQKVFVGAHGARGPRYGYGHGGAQRKLSERTNSLKRLMPYFDLLYDEQVDRTRSIKRMSIGFGNLLPEAFATCDLFADAEAEKNERNLQRAVLAVKGRYGKNALVKGVSFRPEATGRERNDQVGGHHA